MPDGSAKIISGSHLAKYTKENENKKEKIMILIILDKPLTKSLETLLTWSFLEKVVNPVNQMSYHWNAHVFAIPSTSH